MSDNANKVISYLFKIIDDCKEVDIDPDIISEATGLTLEETNAAIDELFTMIKPEL